MTRTVWLQAVSFVDRRDLGGPDGPRPWNPDGTQAAPDLKALHPDLARLSRLDLPSRYVLAAAALLPAPFPDVPADTAVILGSSTGSLDPDRAFAASMAARPMPSIYARTLPTTPGAELAILRGWRGPSFAVVQEGSPGLAALAAAIEEVAAGACQAAVSGQFDALGQPGGPGTAVLCALGSAPAPGAPSRPVTVSRRAPDPAVAPADLRSLYDSFRDVPPDRPFAVEGACAGQVIRVDLGPAVTRWLP